MEKAFILESGESRNGRTLNIYGNQIDIALSSADTGGSKCAVLSRVDPNTGPPLHRHSREDEFFYVIQGRFEFEVDGELIEAGAGACVYAARGTAHTFRNIGITTGRMLTIAEPAGLDAFFEEIHDAVGNNPAVDPAALAPIFAKYGLEVLGPPLAARRSVAAA